MGVGFKMKHFSKVNSHEVEVGFKRKIGWFCSLAELVENVEVYFPNMQTSYVFSIDTEDLGH